MEREFVINIKPERDETRKGWREMGQERDKEMRQETDGVSKREMRQERDGEREREGEM